MSNSPQFLWQNRLQVQLYNWTYDIYKFVVCKTYLQISGRPVYTSQTYLGSIALASLSGILSGNWGVCRNLKYYTERRCFCQDSYALLSENTLPNTPDIKSVFADAGSLVGPGILGSWFLLLWVLSQYDERIYNDDFPQPYALESSHS